jgi:hypothetical protein
MKATLHLALLENHRQLIENRLFLEPLRLRNVAVGVSSEDSLNQLPLAQLPLAVGDAAPPTHWNAGNGAERVHGPGQLPKCRSKGPNS